MTRGTIISVDEWNVHYSAGRDFRPVTNQEAKAFDMHMGEGGGKAALDIGCGTGGFASFLRDRGYSVTGVDYAGEAISVAKARHRAAEHLSFHHWNAEACSWEGFPASTFISCRLSYAFIQDKAKFLRNVKSHLLPGGSFYVMTPLSSDLPSGRRRIGISALESEELCRGWNYVREWKLDAQHACYMLTL